MESVEIILAKCSSISWTVAEVKTNKKRCHRLANRVRALEGLVESISQRGPRQMSLNVNRALQNLSGTLTIAHDLVKKFRNKVVNTVKYRSDFDYVNERLSETYNILSRALQVKQENSTLRMFQDFRLDDDDDDYDDYADGMGLFGAVAPYSGAKAPSLFFPPVAPRLRPTTAVHTVLEVGRKTVHYSESYYHSQ